MKQVLLGMLVLLDIFALPPLVLAAPANSEDLAGWNDAKWGMTPDQVHNALNYPISVADLASVCGEKCDEGAALQLDDYDLNDQHFIVRFWFTKPDRRLHTVSMYAKPVDDAKESEAFGKMKNYLQSVYGPPKSVALERGNFIVRWALPSTRITLYSNPEDRITVIYDEKSGKEDGGQ
jgi:hypothetical protein